MIEKVGAIDIGSNAIRLMIASVIHDEASKKVSYKKQNLVRVPLRLGDDAFINKEISDRKTEDLIKVMQAFKNLLDVNRVNHYIACGTSALREAKNGPQIIKKIRKQTGIDLQIIDGSQEASYIYGNHIESMLGDNSAYLYIDVGGGSTELTLFYNRNVIASRSFNIGTVRILDNLDVDDVRVEIKQWLKRYTPNIKPLVAIGTGGNINKLHRLSKEKSDKPINVNGLATIHKMLESYSLKDRIRLLNLNEDRADVIVPAAEIYLSIMKHAGIKQIYVPRVGLIDGLVKSLISQVFKTNDEIKLVD
jgi:exopolyphosphatase / guanosine-5'-triphosphate,3'-diphosphate pyrophosphatase